MKQTINSPIETEATMPKTSTQPIALPGGLPYINSSFSFTQ